MIVGRVTWGKSYERFFSEWYRIVESTRKVPWKISEFKIRLSHINDGFVDFRLFHCTLGIKSWTICFAKILWDHNRIRQETIFKHGARYLVLWIHSLVPFWPMFAFWRVYKSFFNRHWYKKRAVFRDENGRLSKWTVLKLTFRLHFVVKKDPQLENHSSFW